MPSTDRWPQIALIIVGLVAVCAALELAETFFAPVVLALVTGVVLSPLSDRWEKWGLPPVAVAIIGLLTASLVLALALLAFQPVVSDVVQKAPKVWFDIEDSVERMRESVRGINKAVDDVKEALDTDSEPSGGKLEVEVEAKAEAPLPTVQDAIRWAPSLLGQIFVFGGTLFFFILTRRETYAYVASLLSGPDSMLAERLRSAETKVSRYLLTITCINASMGVVVAVVMMLIGLENPISWGLAAAILNFVLYLGPAGVALGLLFAGIAQFNGPMSVAPAVAYLMINATEAQFVTPTFVGRNMSLNPLAVFLGLTFGLWLWGPVGGVVAIPVMVWLLEMYSSRPTVSLPVETDAQAERTSDDSLRTSSPSS